jgi:Glucan phosphorylase
MAHLAVVGSFAVNGVAELHSKLLTETTFRGFARLWPDRFRNVTNGVTPRRFLRLAELVSATLGGDGWLTDLGQLATLEASAADPGFRDRWRAVKRSNKQDLAGYAARTTGVHIDPDALCDVMIKRCHEYKRQLLKLLHVITLVNRIRNSPGTDKVPRCVVFAGKAAPGYHAAKRIIKLINAVAETVNQDPEISRYLTVTFLPDYNVTRAELIIPAADLSEQISMAGKEASGTGNMKLALGGAVTIGTLDGANIEIRDRVGSDNFFLFGLDAAQATALRQDGYTPRSYYERDPELRAAIDAIAAGAFSPGDRDTFAPILDSILDRDEYLVLADYRAYVDCQDAVAEAWLDTDRWTTMSILNTARCGFFSSDRTVRDYARDIWRVEPVRPHPIPPDSHLS